MMNDSFMNIINKDKPVLIDFFATWCGPCQMLSSVLIEVKAILKDKVSIIKIDVEKNKELATRYKVRGVPSLILFQKGQAIWHHSGLIQKDEIVKVINERIL
ncbi:thioredoxin [Flavobacterium davisii]|uniref:Thioredoxin n=2 Tax=Flavobacterium TaxID=237 RepID=A0ABW8PSA8_9FLAO|nr:thioredoxin [Flavobacterium columnare]